MGKKSGSEKQAKEEKATAFVLKVAMHCNCTGCIDKIRAAAKDITLQQVPGIESWDQSGLESKGELRLVATADPEKLRHRLHRATRKNVDLVVFPGGKDKKEEKQDAKDAAARARAQALLLNSLQHSAWANHQQQQQLMLGGGGGWNAYPSSWPPLQQQQQQLDPYAAAYSGLYPAAAGGAAAAWGGAYAPYPPAQQGWHGYGY